MRKLTEIPRNLRVAGIALALVALLIALVAIPNTVSPVRAQDGELDPKPCGPQDTPEDPDASVSRGHYAIFDGYWDEDHKTLNPNLCPPAVVHTATTTIVGGQPVQGEVSTRYASNIDIRQTVIHIDSVFAHQLTAEDVETYDFFKLGDSDSDNVDDAVGETVWWLMADDDEEENATSTTETEPEFHMGFSAALFDPADWYLDDGDGDPNDKGAKPLQYEFEVIREPGIPVDELGHLFAFDELQPPADTNGEVIKTADWDSSEVDANALALYPGDYYHYQWAFTRPGTYIVSVQLKGHVRAEGDRSADAASDWKPISDKSVETSEVMQYVFQVGDLILNEEPIFDVERSVEEHSATSTPVGDPIPVYQEDGDDLTFTLTGPGHSLFSVAEDDNGDAQIRVADGDLDHDVRSEYHLTLNVGDNKDHESNADSLVDNSILVRINVTSQVPEEERSVDENAAGGTLVGAPIVVAGANASTTYALSGNGSDLFDVVSTSTSAQIEVADGAVLNYEDASSYILTLSADTAGTEDVRVTINVVDDPNEQISVSIELDRQLLAAEITATVTNSPVPTSQLQYKAHAESPGDTNEYNFLLGSPSWIFQESNFVGQRKYWIVVEYRDGGAVRTAQSNVVVIDD